MGLTMSNIFTVFNEYYVNVYKDRAIEEKEKKPWQEVIKNKQIIEIGSTNQLTE